MAYTRTEWVNDVTPINSENLNKIEEQLERLSADYVVETGTDGIWTYRKWNSGKYDAFYSSLEALSGVSVTNSLGGLYKSADETFLLPSFNEGMATISATGSLQGEYSGVWAFQETDADSNDILKVTFWSGVSVSDSKARLSLQIHGTWK